MPATKIKICGLRRMHDLEYANMLMPDYIGFILAEGFLSFPRHISRPKLCISHFP